jgi:hypothetical protein
MRCEKQEKGSGLAGRGAAVAQGSERSDGSERSERSGGKKGIGTRASGFGIQETKRRTESVFSDSASLCNMPK